MNNQHPIPARICPTAGGFLVHDHKVLLVKHKKLGFWLAPGGHIEEGELPHEAAEREVYEETGVRVEVVSAGEVIPSVNVEMNQYLPTPFLINLHWISKENYDARLSSDDPTKPHQTNLWPRGCEQHLGHLYIVKAIEPIVLKHDPNESDGIDWFGESDLASLETTPDIRKEIQLILKLTSTM